jgi:hypothetical protein
MDWMGDPGGVAVVALLGLAVLVLAAIAWGMGLRDRHLAPGEFASGEPETTEEFHLEPQDVHRDNDPPSAL